MVARLCRYARACPFVGFAATPTARVERLLYAIKRPFSYRVKQYLQQTDLPLLSQLIVQERPSKQVFRFWQEGPGYDRNLTSSAALFSVIDYIHNNPVRRGLCELPEQWQWSSWKYYHQPSGPCDPALPTVHHAHEIL